MRRRPKPSAPPVAQYLNTGAWPVFDPIEWPGDTLWQRWEAWFMAQEWVNDLPVDLWVSWDEHAREQMPPMSPNDWIDTLGVLSLIHI